MVILLVLIALAARVDAAPLPDPIDLARRYADAITGGGAARPNRAPALALDPMNGDGDADDETGDGELASVDSDSDDDGDERRRAPADDDELASADPAGDDGDDGDRDELRLAIGDDELATAMRGDATGAARLAIDGDDDAVPDGGALAMLDAELDPGDAAARIDALAASSGAGAQEVYEQWMRHHRPSWLGRLDLGVSWRRRKTEPRHAPARSYDEIWLVATWRR